MPELKIAYSSRAKQALETLGVSYQTTTFYKRPEYLVVNNSKFHVLQSLFDLLIMEGILSLQMRFTLRP